MRVRSVYRMQCKNAESAGAQRRLGPSVVALAVGIYVFGTSVLARADSGEISIPATAVISRIEAAIRMLTATGPGAEIVSRAGKLWGGASASWVESGKIREGRVSRTDATLTRSWDPSTDAEVREREVVVNLRLDQPLQEISLDLAHELTHAVTQPAWDPYDPELRAETYVRNAIDGPGGEVDAILRECVSAFELERKGGVSISRCDRYRRDYEASGTIPRAKIVRDFYASGETFARIPEELRRRIPEITSDPPVYYSSTGESPYPLSLEREYEALNEVACSNTRSRLLRQAGALRAPAASSEQDPAVERARVFLDKRCR
jgi:hypothetical protein